MHIFAGLHYHDTWGSHMTPELKEAVRRLPPSILDQRQERIYIASELNYRQEWLPYDKWTKYDEDVRYLTPFLNDVHREFAEKARYKNTGEFW